MARKRPHERKLRTREHVLADLSVNFVERQILLRGFATNRPHTDYGIDLFMLTYDNQGHVEAGHVFFQVKATDSLEMLKTSSHFSVRIEVADLIAWQVELAPVILVLYDGMNDQAFWIHMQDYLREKNIASDDLLPDQDRITVRIPVQNRLNREAIELFRMFRNRGAGETRKENPS